MHSLKLAMLPYTTPHTKITLYYPLLLSSKPPNCPILCSKLPSIALYYPLLPSKLPVLTLPALGGVVIPLNTPRTAQQKWRNGRGEGRKRGRLSRGFISERVFEVDHTKKITHTIIAKNFEKATVPILLGSYPGDPRYTRRP